MAHRVELSQRAQRDIEEAFAYIHADSPTNAVRWRGGLEQKIEHLEKTPEAFGFAPENQTARADVRQHLFGRYRILYTVREQTVFILTIRHGARRFLTGRELDTIE
jgi:plasmid stabilization system protein ParE